MGLDMYFNKKTYISRYPEDLGPRLLPAPHFKEQAEKDKIDFSRIKGITEEVGYWRKANHIHRWFVENVQDGNDNCQEHYVSKEKIKELLALCKEVKEKARLVKGKLHAATTYKAGKEVMHYEEGLVIENAEEIAELLPTAEGFFFGSTDYNQWYMDDINNTIEILERALEEDGDYYYDSSW